MKWSSINRYIAEAAEFLEAMALSCRLLLSGRWKNGRGVEVKPRSCEPGGWGGMFTDFNQGDFEKLGLTLFTLRNGSPSAAGTKNAYAEKIMFVRKDQVTPFHYHVEKTEDIINRGGPGTGRCVVQLYHSLADGGFAPTHVKGGLKVGPRGGAKGSQLDVVVRQAGRARGLG